MLFGSGVRVTPGPAFDLAPRVAIGSSEIFEADRAEIERVELGEIFDKRPAEVLPEAG